ncbi:MAG: bacteriohopanetetrol glucosamine biosynthesis glycosyltransferase HpnI [Janthinobacterium lividum]
MTDLPETIGWFLLAVAVTGVVYQLAAAVFVSRFVDLAGDEPGLIEPSDRSAVPVTILKPLHGDEPRLRENLASFLAQDYAGVVQLICGVQSTVDPAIAVVEALQRERPTARIELVIDATRHGSNAKVSNLINMLHESRYDVLVLSDSDISVPPDYLQRVMAQLESRGVGAVTCLYHGRGDAGFWSRFAAMGVTWNFLPSVVVGGALGLAEPCMGSTIALRRSTLDSIGQFDAFADVLADDYAIGTAVRAQELAVVVPPFTIAHGCSETSFGDVVRHELRWATTVRGINPGGYFGNGLVNPVPFAVIAAAFLRFEALALIVVGLAIVARLCVAFAADRAARARTGSLLLLPLRDFLSFGVFIGSFLVQSVDWRGTRLRVARDGSIRIS